jgi:hypothetical protein
MVAGGSVAVPPFSAFQGDHASTNQDVKLLNQPSTQTTQNPQIVAWRTVLSVQYALRNKL